MVLGRVLSTVFVEMSDRLPECVLPLVGLTAEDGPLYFEGYMHV